MHPPCLGCSDTPGRRQSSLEAGLCRLLFHPTCGATHFARHFSATGPKQESMLIPMQHCVLHGPYIPRCSQRLLCSWGATASRHHAPPYLGALQTSTHMMPPVRAHHSAAPHGLASCSAVLSPDGAVSAAHGLASSGAVLSPELRASSLVLLLHESFKRAAGR